MRSFWTGLFAVLCLSGTAAAQDVAFTDVRVFDGQEWLDETTVVVQNGAIAAIGADAEIPDGIEIVSGAGKTLLPGLFDAHVHVFYEEALQQSLVFGVTTVLDMFMFDGLATALRQAQSDAPIHHRADLFSAGMLATAPGGHGTQFGVQVDTLTAPDQAADWVEARIASGSDFIKVVLETGESFHQELPTLDAETLRAVIAAAHDRDLLVVTHVQTLEAARQALEAGSDGLAHIFLDEVADEQFVADAAEAGLFVIPTLVVFQSIGDEGVDESIRDDARLNPYLSAQDLANLGAPFMGFEGVSLENALESVRRLHAAGVPILAGTDAMNPGTAYGASLHRELELLTLAGLSPSEALAAATSVPADAFGLQGRGRIVVGAAADLLLVGGDPSAAITDTRDIEGVWRNGVPVDRAAWAEGIEQERAAIQQQEDLLTGDAPVLISDFESGGLQVSFGQPWVPTSDLQAGGNSTAEIAFVDGADSTALQVTGEVGTQFFDPWAGVMFMPGAVPFTPVDLSNVSLLSFDAAGSPSAFRIQMYCENLGQEIAQWSFSVDEDWDFFEVDLSTIGGCDPSGVMALIFSTGEPGPYRLMLDNVTLWPVEGGSSFLPEEAGAE